MVHYYSYPRVLEVRAGAQPGGDGSSQRPFATISQAAAQAQPGDTVLVHEGVYRELVDPVNGGTSQNQRITYLVAEGEKAVIKGSEVVTDWVNDGGSVWKAVLPNSLFGSFNPFATPLAGDWLEQPATWSLSLGDVYLNGQSFYQARSLEDVRAAEQRVVGPGADWREYLVPLSHPEDTVYQWYAEVSREQTTIWANFQSADPTDPANLVEVNVRPSCFYPHRTGRDYITVRGFELAQAACGWAPPTGDQVGLIGPHWAKGWVIEDNVIHDAKCSAISLGKDYSTGEQAANRQGRMTGHRAQLEDVFLGLHRGWDKESVGGHTVRRNRIYDCGQNGVVGHMGCAFSLIEDNDISRIGLKREFFGHEIAGIKFHAGIDVVLRANKIHQCTLGTWLDWQAQGTRVSQNLYYDNERDFMIEVTHGPCLIDNNIFASERTMDNFAQGTAFVHNLFLGGWINPPVLDRQTPYHFPHTTQVRGYMCVYGGDDRFYNNIFVGRPSYGLKQACFSGTAQYDGSTTSVADYLREIHEKNVIGQTRERFETVQQPVFINANAYLAGAPAFAAEQSNYVSAGPASVSVTQAGDGSVWLEGDFDPALFDLPTRLMGTDNLGEPLMTRQPYENPDGTPLRVDTDLCGQARDSAHPTPGPLEALAPGHNRIRVA